MQKLIKEEKKCWHSTADTLYMCFTKIKLLCERWKKQAKLYLWNSQTFKITSSILYNSQEKVQ